MCPRAHVLGCSTGGQIRNDDVTDDEIAAAALRFDATKLRLACEPADSSDRSRACGDAIGRKLQADDLAGIFILSDGLTVNGSVLRDGIASVGGQDVPLTGRLSGPCSRVPETVVSA